MYVEQVIGFSWDYLSVCGFYEVLSLEYSVLSFAGRNSDYVDLNVRFTVDVIKMAIILRMVPDFLKP